MAGPATNHHASLAPIAPVVILDQAPPPGVRRRRRIGAWRTFGGVAGVRRTAGVGTSWHRIQYSPTAIAPPTSSKSRSGDARRGLKGRIGIMCIPYTGWRSVTSRIRSPQVGQVRMRPAEGKEAQLPVILTEGRKDNEALRGQKWTTHDKHRLSSNLRFDPFNVVSSSLSP